MRARIAGFAAIAAACGSSAAPGARSTAPSAGAVTLTPAAGPTSLPVASATRTDAGAPGQDPSHRQARLIARMLKRVERARGLTASRPVPGVLLDRPALIAQVKEHVSRELPGSAIHDEGLTLQLLGFVPVEFDYEAAEYRLLQEQLAGYYEPSDGTMYMASDLADDEADATLAHELVHALQDQQWNLQERSKYRPGDGDRSEAVSALAEGDATSAMIDVMLDLSSPGGHKTAVDLPPDLFSDQIRDSLDKGPGAAAPHVMRNSLAAPYVYGIHFVNALRIRGGWDEVDRAWTDPPTTSEQILHVDKWLAHEPPIHVAPPSYATLGSGWTVADEDSEGELGTRVAYEEWVDAARAAKASVGWGGDRGVLLSRGDQSAFAWRVRYDPTQGKEPRAADVYKTISSGIDRTVAAPSKNEPTFDCRERPDRGPLAIARAGADIIVVAGPATTPSGGRWTSAGTCATSRAWVTEIARIP